MGSLALGQQPAPSEPVFRSSNGPLQKVTAPEIPPSPSSVQPPAPTVVRPPAPSATVRPPVPAPALLTSKVVPVQAVQPMADPTAADELKQYQILLEPPSREALFSRLESEKAFEERMRQQARQQMPPNTVRFPDRPVLSTAEFQGRAFPQQTMIAEPRFTCYHRLYFEEKNAERYGWDLGFIQPLVSVLYFYKDLAFLPHNLASKPFRRYECDAGYCLPGDPVPYILYPPEFTMVGGIAEGAFAVGLIAILP